MCTTKSKIEHLMEGLMSILSDLDELVTCGNEHVTEMMIEAHKLEHHIEEM